MSKIENQIGDLNNRGKSNDEGIQYRTYFLFIIAIISLSLGFWDLKLHFEGSFLLERFNLRPMILLGGVLLTIAIFKDQKLNQSVSNFLENHGFKLLGLILFIGLLVELIK